MSDLTTFVQDVFNTVIGFFEGVWGEGVDGVQGIFDAFTNLSS